MASFKDIYGIDLNRALAFENAKKSRRRQKSPKQPFDTSISFAPSNVFKLRQTSKSSQPEGDGVKRLPFHKIVEHTSGTSIEGGAQPSEFSQTSASFFPFSIAKVRNSRVKIENDVLQMHNRINLLEAEEKRALKRIDETRKKAD